MTFKGLLDRSDVPRLRQQLEGVTPARVEAALARSEPDFGDFLALTSPAAEKYLEPMAQRVHDLTLQRFGRVILLYTPLYVSNECTNACAYCGFNLHRQIERMTLTLDEVIAEAAYLKQIGFGHLLLVCGEAPNVVPPAFLIQILEALRTDFPSLSLEIYPLSGPVYAQMTEAGADGLTLYQETYQRDAYDLVHPSGRKRNFDWRLGALERAGQAGFRRLGIGALLGLYDWRYEAIALALHADYLMRHFWKSQVTVSFPRLRHTPEAFQPAAPVNDAALVQMMLALRIYLPDAGLVLSTREPAYLRDHLIGLGVTQMSAGSRTEPGGYLHPAEDRGQFLVEDHRTPGEVAQAIRQAGYEPVWKDWDQLLHESTAHENYRQRDAEGRS
ncbi:MAG: 2-iminoacetate synthase ThiH [bacterium]|nr:2-iminoacetate synthase ThiH [bacterium]